MIELYVHNQGRDVATFIDGVQAKLRQGVIAGMGKAMPELADYVVNSKLSGQMVKVRSGQLAAAVRNSSKVWEGNEAVAGYVKAPAKIGARKLPVGYWLSKGTSVPAVDLREGTFSTMIRQSTRRGRPSLMVPGTRQIAGGSGTQAGKPVGLRVMVFDAEGGYGQMTKIFTRKHRAFKVSARPFMELALREYQARIVERIQQSVVESLQ